jgi:hypothetical protein
MRVGRREICVNVLRDARVKIMLILFVRGYSSHVRTYVFNYRQVFRARMWGETGL